MNSVKRTFVRLFRPGKFEELKKQEEENVTLEKEKKKLERISGEWDRDWTKTREACPKCSYEYLYSAERKDYTYSTVADTSKGEPMPTVYVHGIAVDATTKRVARVLQLLVCPDCEFKGYRIVAVGKGYTRDDVRYSDDWELLD